MYDVWDVLANDDAEKRQASRTAVAMANKRVKDKFGQFLATDAEARFEFVKDEIEALVTATAEEYEADPAPILAGVLASLTPQKQIEPRTAAVVEARKPKLCPYHSEVMDISLAEGSPRAGFDAMAQHAWGPKHCKGDEYEGSKCNFKKEFTTQAFWDNKKEQAEQRRQEREEQRAQPVEELVVDEITEDEPELIEETPVEETSDDNVVEVDFSGEVDGEPSAVSEGAPEELAVAASTDAPLADRTADLRKEAPGGQHSEAWGESGSKRNRQYEHIKEQCLADGGSEEHCKEMAARTVNKTRAEHGETKGSKTAEYPGSINNQTGDEFGNYGYETADGVGFAQCPQCGGEGTPLGQLGALSHYRCRNCGYDFAEPAQVDEGPEYEPGDLRGQDSYSSVIAEALETVDIKKNTHPDYKRDRGPGEQPDDEMDGSPHPTVTVDITEPIVYKNDETPFEGTNAVSEKQDVEKAEGAQKGKGGTFPKGNGANPVTSAADVRTNPVREILLEQEEDGFLGNDEVAVALAKRR